MPTPHLNHHYSRRSFGALLAGALAARATPDPQQQQLKYGLWAEYFNLDRSQRTPQFPDRTAEVQRIDRQIGFDWSLGGPMGPRGAIGPRDFGVRWTGFLLVPEPGVVTFVAAHRGGLRCVIGGEMVYDSWTRPSASGTFVPKQFEQAGWYPLRFEFHSGRTRSALRVEWALPNSPKRTAIPPSNLAHLPKKLQ